MKKFLGIAFIVIVCILTYTFFVYEKGWYTSFSNDNDLEVVFTSRNDEIQYNNQRFIIRGVTLNSNLPNSEIREYSPKKEDYLRWLNQIHEMGANTIRLVEILDSDFYDALYEFNYNNSEPLYLIQGISLTDYMNNNSKDAYDDKYIKNISERSKIAVDVIHGRKNIVLNRGYGLGNYRRDVSKWLIGYIIGEEWNSYTIAYTNNEQESGFKGEYFETVEGANAFESLLARQMNEIIKYETEKYNHQSLISFSSSLYTDPFEYDEYYAGQVSKFVSLDLENIKATENLRTGYFASYSLINREDKYYEYFSEKEKNYLQSKSINDEGVKDNYLKLLKSYHTMPIIISSYGYSTSRGISLADNEGPLTEKEQGELLVSRYEEIVSLGFAGGVIDSWSDNWSVRSWNTSYALDVNNFHKWGDVQTESHGYGLMSFDIKDHIYNLDGNKSEWINENIISENKDLKIFVKNDAKYLYFLLEGAKEEENYIIPIDVTPNSGSLSYYNKSIKFNRNVDFIIEINGKEDSKILVQDYYNSLRENYLSKIEGKDPFVDIPEKEASDFGIIQTVLNKDKVLEKEDVKYDVNGIEINQNIYNEVYDTGKLIYGNSDPESDNYNSLSDFYYGDNFLEIRIPWQLLNFYNPAKRQIHDDYYKNYGIEPMIIDSIYVGAGVANDFINLGEYKLKGWRRVKTAERLKESYEILKEYWGGY